MLIRKSADIPYSEVTPKSLYLRRREFFQTAAGGAIAAAAMLAPTGAGAQTGPKLPNVRKSQYGADEQLNDYDDVTGYNNFYEFGTDKADPKANAQRFTTRPWTIRVEGLVKAPATHDIDSFIKPHALEERIYRLRCVEGWSMVIPWVGIPLADVIQAARAGAEREVRRVHHAPRRRTDAGAAPAGSAVAVRRGAADGRSDEPAVDSRCRGVRWRPLPNQNGAPIRLVVPWKYGFKSIKSIVRIRFTEDQPRNSWEIAAPREYGFYANVNPEVNHPRWSQATERRLGRFFRQDTEMFNGYSAQVAQMYSGMDLRRNF